MRHGDALVGQDGLEYDDRLARRQGSNPDTLGYRLQGRRSDTPMLSEKYPVSVRRRIARGRRWVRYPLRGDRRPQVQSARTSSRVRAVRTRSDQRNRVSASVAAMR